MKKLIIILTCFLGIASSVCAFPNIKSYPHEVRHTDRGVKVLHLSHKEAVVMNTARFGDFDGYMGYCKLTKNDIYINGDGPSSTCYIVNNNDKIETSTYTVEQCIAGSEPYLYFSFPEGTVVSLKYQGKTYAYFVYWANQE